MVKGLRHGAFRRANANVQQDTGRKQASGNATARGQCREATASRFAADSPMEEAGFELVWGFFCQVLVFGLLPVLCSEREGRSSFFNRAAGVKRVLSASGLRGIVVQHAGGTSLAKCCFFVRLRAVSSSRPFNRHANRTSVRRWFRLCPGSEQEGPACVAQCPHERRGGARGRCPFAHRGKAGVVLSRGFLNSLRPTGSWFFPRSARYERAATWRLEGRHRYVPCAINAVRRVATKNAGLPCLVPAGRATA